MYVFISNLVTNLNIVQGFMGFIFIFMIYIVRKFSVDHFIIQSTILSEDPQISLVFKPYRNPYKD